MKKCFVLAVFIVMFLAACGDDVTKVTNITQETSGLEVVASADSLGKCTAERSGEMKFAQKENAAFVCADSVWKNASEAGKDGSDGKDGTSCTVELLVDSSGYKVVCGGDSVGVIFNGEKGSAGKDGETCSFADDGDGTILQICGKDSVTLYKALCGNKPFDPTKSFCVADSAVSLCGGKVYDLSENFCFEDSVYSFCGGKKFSPETHFCFGDSLYQRCNGVIYNPSNEMCFNDSVHELCGGEIFDPNLYLCLNDSLCSNEDCKLCGKNAYLQAENFCFEDSVYAFCGGKKFNPQDSGCYDGQVLEILRDMRDGQAYRITRIGNQIWMAENLNYAYMPDTSSFCLYDNPENCEKYGRFYTWAAAMDSAAVFTEKGKGCSDGIECFPIYPVRGICPEGWHLPDSADWKILETFVGERAVGNVVGGDREDRIGSALVSKNDVGSDEFGFSALLAGYISGREIFEGFERNAVFWSSFIESTKYKKHAAIVFFIYDYRFLSTEDGALAASIRCIKD